MTPEQEFEQSINRIFDKLSKDLDEAAKAIWESIRKAKEVLESEN